MADVRLKIVSKNGRTHLEDDAGNRIWGVKSIKWEVDESSQPICTVVMYGVAADLDVTPTIKVTPTVQGFTRPVILGPVPRRGGKKKIFR